MFGNQLTFDGVEDRNHVGVIRKDGVVVGRVDIGSDGKAMIFVGEFGNARVKTPSGSDAMYSDDDAASMVNWLFSPTAKKPANMDAIMQAIRAQGWDVSDVQREDDDGLDGDIVDFMASRKGVDITIARGDTMSLKNYSNQSLVADGSYIYNSENMTPEEVALWVENEYGPENQLIQSLANNDLEGFIEDFDQDDVTPFQRRLVEKPEKFIRSALKVNEIAERSGITINWGDFNHTAKMAGLFDAADLANIAVGVCAQIGGGGGLTGRVNIDADGNVLILQGSSGDTPVTMRSGGVATPSQVNEKIEEMMMAATLEDIPRMPDAPKIVKPAQTPQADTDLARLDVLKQAASGIGKVIESSDPNAVEKINTKLAYLTAYSEMMKKANKLHRKSDDAGLRAMGFSDKIIAGLKTPDFAGRTGFPDYEITNNNSEIRRLKKRLEELGGAEKNVNNKNRKIEEALNQYKALLSKAMEYSNDLQKPYQIEYYQKQVEYLTSVLNGESSFTENAISTPSQDLWNKTRQTIEAEEKQNSKVNSTKTYRYGMRSRPFSIGAQPKGAIAVHENEKDDERYRHGVVEYDRKLTQKEVDGFELVTLADDAEMDALASKLAAEMSEYASEYIDEYDADSMDFKIGIDQEVSKIYKNGVICVNCAKYDKENNALYREVYSRLQAIAGAELPRNNKTSPTIESRLAAIDAFIGKPEFDDLIDTLISDIDAAGMMEKFEPELLRLDRENSNAIVKASGI